MATDYEQIRKENIEEYGKGTRHLQYYSKLYSDETHFIFELIQNAEDAFASYIEFKLFHDKIEIIHNGKKLFDEKDVRGICGIGEGTKQSDLTKIGKFGLGFKSVYAYTNIPMIFSRDETFKIENFVRPWAINPLLDVDKKLTKFILPFKAEKITTAFSEIKNKIQNLDLKTILFLKDIKSIKWSIEGEKSGMYERRPKKHNHFEINQIVASDSEGNKFTEDWLIEHKPIELTEDEVLSLGENNVKIGRLKVELAFKLEYKEEDNSFVIIPENKTELVVFFPTNKETHLRFLVQGPYRTTPTRENINFNDAWNKILLNRTSDLIQTTLSKFKETNLLDASLLQLFPIEKEVFNEEKNFETFYNSVKNKILSGDEILPTNEGDYVSAQNALLARTKELRDLLKSEQISFLFKKDARWLDSNITVDRMPLLRKYLIEDIGLQEITPEKFASSFAKEFIANQNDEWVIEFYNFLSKQPALWREKKRLESEGVLRNKPIIRLESNNDHVCPFDNNDNPQVFLASGSSYDSMFPIIKKNIAKSPLVKEFLKTLGIKEPNKVAGIRQHILPKYNKDKIQVDKEENLRDVEYIKKTINSEKSAEVDELIKDLKSTTFLIATNPTTNKSVWNSPSNTYLGKKCIKSDDLDIYFENNEEVFFLDDSYSSLLTLDDLKKLGCNNRIVVKCRTPSEWNHHITLRDWHGSHERGLDGFDPDCEIEGLAFALENINLDKARIIWTYLMRYAKSIKGIIEYSQRQDFSSSTKKEKLSKMGKLVVEHTWLPDKSGNYFHKPEELYLSELHDSLDKESIESINIAKKIMRKEIEQKILETCSETEKEKMEKLLALSKKYSIEQIETTLSKLEENKQEKKKMEKDNEWTPECEPETIAPPIQEVEPDKIITPDLSNQTESNEAEKPAKEYDEKFEEETDELPIDKKAIGKWGEKCVYHTLLRKYQEHGEIIETDSGFKIIDSNNEESEIVWLNKNRDIGKGYDLCIKQNGIEVEYIEVKSKTQEDPELIEIQGTQWEFARKLFDQNEGEKYSFYVVLNAGRENATITVYRNPVKLWKEGKLYAHPVNFKL